MKKETLVTHSKIWWWFPVLWVCVARAGTGHLVTVEGQMECSRISDKVNMVGFSTRQKL